MYQKYIKRWLDICLSGLGLMILSPFFLLIIIAIKKDSSGPVLFKQKRVGIHKTHFNILKFRTMRTDTPKDMPTHMLADPEQYITKVGKFLRKTSLDEKAGERVPLDGVMLDEVAAFNTAALTGESVPRGEEDDLRKDSIPTPVNRNNRQNGDERGNYAIHTSG